MTSSVPKDAVFMGPTVHKITINIKLYSINRQATENYGAHVELDGRVEIGEEGWGEGLGGVGSGAAGAGEL